MPMRADSVLILTTAELNPGCRRCRVVVILLGILVASSLVLGAGTSRAATGAAAFHPCPGTHELLSVSDVHNVTVAAACGVWTKVISHRQTFVRCHGRPLTEGSYPVVVKKLYRGWHLSEGKASPLRFSRGGQFFEGTGQDTPPYPC